MPLLQQSGSALVLILCSHLKSHGYWKVGNSSSFKLEPVRKASLRTEETLPYTVCIIDIELSASMII